MQIPSNPAGFGRLEHTDPKAKGFPLSGVMAALERESPIAVVPRRKRWYLRRADQEQQGDTPECVAATGKEWERALPLHRESGLTRSALYARCKAIDGHPTEDGTDAGALMKVYQSLGMVASYHWHFAGDDEEALKLWLLTRGGAWFGSYWTRSMFATDARGYVEVTGDQRYGHEVFVLAYDRDRDEVEFAQSWGLEMYGPQTGPYATIYRGRGRLRWPAFRSLIAGGGDVVVAVQCPPPAAAVAA